MPIEPSYFNDLTGQTYHSGAMLNATTRAGKGKFRLMGNCMSFVRFHHTSGQPDGCDELRSTSFTGTLSPIGDRSLRGAEMVGRANTEMMQPQKMKGQIIHHHLLLRRRAGRMRRRRDCPLKTPVRMSYCIS